MARLDIKESTLKKLFALSGNQCAFPKCPQRLFDEHGTLIADICHIEAAEEGGQRFNKRQTDEQRRAFENLLVLCRNHHAVTNNVSVYPAAALLKIKREHEAGFATKPFELDDERLRRLSCQLACIATSKLPQHGTDTLVGRDEWLQRIEDAWHDPQVHVVSIVAEGGVGKTALAVEWMTRLGARDWPGVERYFDWSFYSQGLREQGGASADAFVDAALNHFGDATPRSTSPYKRGERLAQLAAEHATGLILDGVEPLQHGPGPARGRLKDPALGRLLRGLAQRPFHGLCVVTTREPITDLASFRGKTVREWTLDRLSEEAGAELLHNSGARHSGATPILRGDAELRAASREIDGHALTLRLLGRYLAKAHGGDIRRRDRVELWKADEKQGGHASKVMRAYEEWLAKEGGAEGKHQLAILRLLGLFDRPASTGCIAALRTDPVIEGLTEPLVGIDEDDWNAALFDLEESRLLIRDGSALDVHPLYRAHFARRLRDEQAKAWRTAHGRLFDYLKNSTERYPETISALQPLYQAVVHGCHSGRHRQACDAVYCARILRGEVFFSTKALGAFAADLGAIACFFDKPWTVVSASFTTPAQAWLLNEAASRLRGLGRLQEAIEPLFDSLALAIELEHWERAAQGAENLSELRVSLGDLGQAVRDAEQSVAFADRSRNDFERLSKRTALADALYQSGRGSDAHTLFRHAESMLTLCEPVLPLLYGLQGFRYCDFLLADAERMASRGQCPSLVGECLRVEHRATQTLAWAKQWSLSQLATALSQLALARARFYRALLDGAAPDGAEAEVEQATDSLYQAGWQEQIPRGLLTRAWLRSAMNNSDGACVDLDEAQEIAERGPMPLHLADVNLYRARLFKDRDALKKARELIDKHGYERRRGELEDAEEMAKSW